MPSKSKLATKITRLLTEGRQAIDALVIKPEIVVFVGPTGVGKSTLINGVNGIELRSFSEDGSTYKYEAKDPSKELPGIKIAHFFSTTSCTRHPASHNPPTDNYSYVDVAGFGDTGNRDPNDSTDVRIARAAQDIANAHFRKAVIDRTQALKIVLVVSKEDLENKGVEFTRALKDLARFMEGVKDPAARDSIKNAVSIVVTKINHIPTIQELQQEVDGLKAALAATSSNPGINATLGPILAEKEAKLLQLQASPITTEGSAKLALTNFIDQSVGLDPDIQVLLRHVVSVDHFAVFTKAAPSATSKSMDEASKIKDVIRSTTSVTKEVARIGIKVSEDNESLVKDAIEDLEALGKKLAKSIDQDITDQLAKAFMAGNWVEIKKIHDGCLVVNGYGTKRALDAFIQDTKQHIHFSDKTNTEYEEFNTLLKFLVSLLPEVERKNYSYEQVWRDKLELGAKLVDHISSAKDILDETPQHVFKDGKLTVKGYQVKTSKVAEEVKKYADIKSVEVQALHTITMDDDLDTSNVHKACNGKLHGTNLSMTAPYVVGSGTRVINLSGKHGKDHHTTAPSGSSPGAAGSPGVPGGSGSSAGHFFMASDKVDTAINLQVILNGGNGGKGQNGGSGVGGADGKDAPCVRGVELTLPIVGKVVVDSKEGWTAVGAVVDHGNGTKDQEHGIDGKAGGKGGAAGQGGKGGDFGKAGKSTIAILDKYSASTTDGSNGTSINTDGAAGSAGTGGVNGQNARGIWHTGGNPDNGWNGWTLPHLVGNGRASSGDSATTVNTVGWQSVSKILQQNIHLTLLRYKFLAEQEAMKHPQIVGSLIRSFERHLEKIKVTDVHTTVKDLLEEARVIESYSSDTTNKSIDFIPFYQSLIARVKDFAQTPGRTTVELKVLEYLYAFALGSIAHIDSASDHLLIIDVHQYLNDLAAKDFQDLRDMKVAEMKRHYQTQYTEGVEAKIKEADSFLDILKRDIESRQQSIAPQIIALEAEVAAMKDQAGHDKSALETKRHQLEEAMKTKFALGIISVAVQGIGMIFPPAGPIVAGVVNAGINMAANPSIETALNFAGKVVSMKEELGKLPTAAATTKHEADLFKKVKEIAKTVAPLIKDAQAVLGAKSGDAAKLAALDNEIGKITAYIAELDTYLKTVPAALGGYLQGMVHDVSDFQSALQDKSLVALDFSKLEMKRFFEGVKHNIKALTGKFASSQGFEDIVTRLEEAIDVTTNICSRVQDYRDHIAFANFIAHLQSPSIVGLDVGAEYQNELTHLQLAIQQNVVQEAYTKAVAAIKQWSFPFADKFLSSVPNLEATDYTTMAQNLPEMLRYIDRYKTCVAKMDAAVNFSSFNTDLVTKPFFTWDHGGTAQKMQSLLSGEKVVLTADVRKSKYDCVKFKQIGIKLECDTVAKQAELNVALQDYQVTLEHNGVSYYRYSGNIYKISNDKPIEIGYSFQMQPAPTVGLMQPVVRTGVYDKMVSPDSDIILSPYTSWIVQIKPVPTATHTTTLYDKFKGVMQGFKLHLVGEGSYVDESKVNGELHLERYYHKLVNDVDVLGDVGYA